MQTLEKIMEMLEQKARIKKILEEPAINKFRITEEAFNKMNLYSKIASEIAGEDIECRGFLLNYKDRFDDITRDVYLEPCQQVTSVKARSEWTGERTKMFETINQQNKKAAGTWHSHGNMTSFHSDDDDRWLEQVYTTNRNKVELAKFDCEFQTIQEDENTKIKIGDRVITIKGKPSQIKAEQVIEKRFSNSIVTCSRLYAENKVERGRTYYCESLFEGKNGEEKAKNLEIELVKENNPIEKDPKKLVEECGERIEHEGKLLKEYPNYQSVLQKYSGLEEKLENYGFRQRLRNFYQNYKVVDEVDRAIVTIAKITAGDYKQEKPTIKKTLGMVANCAYIGLLAASILALKTIERKTTNYLNKKCQKT